MSGPNDHRPSIDRDLAATLALAAFSLAVAAGFARVFSGWAFFADLGLLIVLGHGASFALRRARVSGWIATPLLLIFLLWVLIASRYGDTLSWLLPTGETRAILDLELGLVRDQFATAIAPVLYGTGWATLAGLAIVITVVISDAFAFRAEARGESLVPGGVLFVFISALGSPRLRIAGTALLIGTAVLAVIALRALHDRSRRVELTSRRTPSMFIPAALASALAIALLAGVVGPRIPGANAEPLYETKGRGGGVTNIISPLVDIQSRLTNRSNVELFRVNADAPAYWRITTLGSFDGRRFAIPERRLDRVDGQFDTSDGAIIRQQIQVLALGGKLIPAAADPFQAEGVSAGQRLGLNINQETDTLLAPDEMLPGDLFTVVSSAARLDPAQLRGATTANPEDDMFIELPDDLPSIVAELATQVTAGAGTQYDRAIALQNWFRSDFDYSLEVAPGHGSNAIESFLNQRVGYCEQFSATFAAMARTLGIPSRVAVGFTPGLQNSDGWYSVLGKNAHAWPELWFDGIGWVAFEPTPGRGVPGAESYTDVPAAQDTSGQQLDGSGNADATGAPNPTTPSTVVAGPTSEPTTATTAPNDDRTPSNRNVIPDLGDDPRGGSGTTPATPVGSVPWTTILLAAALFAALGAPAITRWVRARSALTLSPADRVQLAWSQARRAAQRAGVGGRDSMTAREWAAATSATLPVAARPMASLADVVDRVSYAPPGSYDLERAGAFGATLRHDCELWSNQIGRIANDALTTRQSIRRYFTDWS
ncbi:MAG: transglutaminaseTgpA domain-containing protein [Ilumatobacteraceae bacterium]